jgi:hypothetical protein
MLEKLLQEGAGQKNSLFALAPKTALNDHRHIEISVVIHRGE